MAAIVPPISFLVNVKHFSPGSLVQRPSCANFFHTSGFCPRSARRRLLQVGSSSSWLLHSGKPRGHNGVHADGDRWRAKEASGQSVEELAQAENEVVLEFLALRASAGRMLPSNIQIGLPSLGFL